MNYDVIFATAKPKTTFLDPRPRKSYKVIRREFSYCACSRPIQGNKAQCLDCYRKNKNRWQ